MILEFCTIAFLLLIGAGCYIGHEVDKLHCEKRVKKQERLLKIEKRISLLEEQK
jgi:hypothetical protein